MNATTLPGRTSSSSASLRSGFTVTTVISASLAVLFFRWERAIRRLAMPHTASISATTRTISSTRFVVFFNFSLSSCDWPAGADCSGMGRLSGVIVLLSLFLRLIVLMHDGEYSWHKEERRERGENQPANHGAAQRGILLAALAHPYGHPNH